MSNNLTGKQRRYLRALAHALQPVVQIGHAGLTPPVLKAIDQALETHELIKVRVQAETGAEVRGLVEEVESGLTASVAQIIGHTLLVYRRRKKDPKIQLPKDTPRKTKEE
ncbi:MAG: ribosome assembly RNA-binding protein YhbY [Myxococcota bacterium]